jgi:ABC-type multidrug transport system ATPase subunit
MTVKNVAVKNNVLVIATIHQPNWDTFSLFDSLLLLANGSTIYSGPLREHPFLSLTFPYP